MTKIMKRYIFFTYAVFWCFLLLILLEMYTIKSGVLTTILQIVSSWTPITVFTIMFHKLFPGQNFWGYLKRQFHERIHLPILLSIIAIQLLALLANAYIAASLSGKPMLSLLLLSPGFLVVTFFTQLIYGPIGEELGWRAYILTELQTKYSPLKSTVIVWLIWSFWHLPLWFLTTGFTGMKLLQYSIMFLLFNLGGSILITAFYNLNHNLIIPILIHQLFNFLGCLIKKTDNIQILTTFAFIYLFIAIIVIAVNYKHCLRKRNLIPISTVR